MFRCFRAVLASPFRRRPSRSPTPPNVPPSAQPPPGTRPRRPGPRPAVLAAAAAGTALAACADSVWEPLAPGTGREDGRPMAALVSETRGFLADVDSLPSWRKVIEGMAEPGCVFHFRRLAGSYASKEYGLAYSRKATAKAEAWKALVYNVLVTVSRPAEGGGTEVLPERLAIRAVCAMPDTKHGTEEATGRTEAILEAHGIKFPGADKSEARAPWAAEGSRALAALRRAVGRLGPRPLRAVQQNCISNNVWTCPDPMEELDVTVRRPIRCSAGFDYQPTSGECVRHTLGGGSTSGGSGNSGSSGSSGGGNTNHNNNNNNKLRDVEFTLSCPGSVERGSSAVCRVGTEDDEVIASEISYDWSAGDNGKSGKGSGFVSWSGPATSTKTVSVTVSGPGIRSKNLSTTVQVSARSSFFPSSAAAVSTEHISSETTWGRFDVPLERPDGPRVTQGQGPWFGEWIASRGYDLSTAIVLSSDLDATGVAYGGANQTCLTTLPADSAVNVYGANYRCGLTSELARLYDILLAHEREHERSLNLCLASSTGRAFIDFAEGVMPKTGSDAQADLDQRWADFWPTLLASAYGSVTDRTGPTVWSWRANQRWQLYQHNAPGHGKALGC